MRWASPGRVREPFGESLDEAAELIRTFDDEGPVQRGEYSRQPVTDDVVRLVDFYERATGTTASWSNEHFAELRTTSATLAIGSTRTVPLFAPGSARPADNHSVILEFLVDDVDSVHKNLTGFVEDFVNGPTTMPWGNRALLFRDPDGNLVNFFTPVTPAAIEKFAR